MIRKGIPIPTVITENAAKPFPIMAVKIAIARQYTITAISLLLCGITISIPFAITSPTPAAVNNAPKAANTCGKSPTGPILSISLVPSFIAYSFFEPVTPNTTINAIIAESPTALFAPSFFQTVAIIHALSASTKGAIKILFPSLFALALVSSAVGTSLALCPTLPIAVSIAISTTHTPVINLGT